MSTVLANKICLNQIVHICACVVELHLFFLEIILAMQKRLVYQHLYSKTCLKQRLIKKTKNLFSRPLNAGKEYFRMLHWSILQYFRPSLSYHLSFA